MLVNEFEIQELQLRKWGLMHVLHAFRMQVSFDSLGVYSGGVGGNRG
jgi:hypothetical protein